MLDFDEAGSGDHCHRMSATKQDYEITRLQEFVAELHPFFIEYLHSDRSRFEVKKLPDTFDDLGAARVCVCLDLITSRAFHQADLKIIIGGCNEAC